MYCAQYSSATLDLWWRGARPCPQKKSPIVAPRAAEGLGSLRVVCPLGLPIHATGVCSKPGTGGWGAASLLRRGLAAPLLLGFTGMCGSFGRTGRRGGVIAHLSKCEPGRDGKAESATRGFLPTPNSWKSLSYLQFFALCMCDRNQGSPTADAQLCEDVMQVNLHSAF